MIKKHKKSLSLLTALSVMFNFFMPSTTIMAEEINNVSVNTVSKEQNTDGDSTTIQILATSDTHGKFTNYDFATNSVAAGGMNQIATVVKEEKAKNPNTLVLDNGDTIQGNNNFLFLKEDYLSSNVNPMILAMSEIGYDTFNLGNHEFNYGMGTLNTIVNQAKENNISVLCANLYKDGKRVYNSYKVKEVNGIKVAIIGVVHSNIVNWDHEALKGYEAKNPAEEVKKVISEIKANDAADIYVVTTHTGIEASEELDGNSAEEIAKLNPEVTAIVAGHSHVSNPSRDVEGVLISQPKNSASEIVKIQLDVTKNEDGVKVTNKSSELISLKKDSKEDEDLNAKLQSYKDYALEDGKKVIGTLEGADLAEPNEVKGIAQSFVSDQGVIDLINEVQMYYSDKQLKSIGVNTENIHHVTGSAMLSAEANLYSGNITRADLANIYKFDNKLYTIKTTGKQLKTYLEWTAGLFDTFQNGDLTVTLNKDFRTYLYDGLTGVNYDINISKEVGSRIENLTFTDGTSVKDTDEVYLTLNNYRFDSNLAPIIDEGSWEKVYDSTDDSLSDIRDMIADYIQNVKGGTITRNVDNNWKLTGVNYENKALRDAVVKLVNDGTISLEDHLTYDKAVAQLQAAGLTDKVAELEALSGNDNKVIDVVSFNDFHGSALESGKNIGAAKLAGVIKARQALQNDKYAVIPVSGGDSYQGSAISNLTLGDPETELFKAIGLEASAIGNHEFDWGSHNFEKWATEGGFNFLAANMVYEATGKTIDGVDPYKIVEKNGVKIAFIGLATEETLTATKAENVEGIKFLGYEETLKKYIKIVKEQGADAVIALTHCGSFQDSKTGEITGEAADIANANIEGLDAIVSAHSHKTVSGKVNGVPIVQAYYNGRALSTLKFTFDKDNKLVSVEPNTELLYPNSDELPVDEDLKAKLSELEGKLSSILGEVVTTLDERLNNDDKYDNVTDLGVVVAETMRQIGKAQIGLTNGGGIRRSLEAGNVTVGDMYEILPFDNYIVNVELSGEDLKAVLQHGIKPDGIGWGQYSGVKVYYNPETYEITDMYLADGTKIEMDKYYTVAINDFMVTGGDGYDFSNAKSIYNTNECMRDSISDYWKAKGIPVCDYKVLLPNTELNPGEAEKPGTGEGEKPGTGEGDNTKPEGEKPATGDANNGGSVVPGTQGSEANNSPSKVEDVNNAKTSDYAQIEILAITTLMLIACAGVEVSRRKKNKRA